MSVKLSLAALANLPARVAAPKYRRSDLKAGIVHIGVGNFHRAHQAVYLDDLFNAGPTTTGRWWARASASRTRHAREARGAGLADDGRRAGGGRDHRRASPGR